MRGIDHGGLGARHRAGLRLALGERTWINPSPNAPNLWMARCYAGTVMLEGTTLSEGRGTTRPLELFGAPDLEPRKLLAEMQRLAPRWLQGCRLRECWFEPTFHKHAGTLCAGVQIHVEDGAYDHVAFRPWRLMALAGVFLGAHFATWVPSLRFTTVASSTALVATQPVWAALIARRRGVQIDRVAWIGIGISLVGVLVLTGIDFALTPRALIGDALALAGAVLAALYVTVGEQVRSTTSNPVYTMLCYATAGVFLLGLVILLRVPLLGFSTRDWVLILAITLGAQLLGHSVVNRVLATTSATVVSLAILLEMPGATIAMVAWLTFASWWNEVMMPQTVPNRPT